VRVDKNIEIGPDAWHRVRWHEITKLTSDVIAPEGDLWVTAISREVSLTDYKTFHDTVRQLVVFGHVEYQGLDGTEYWSEYCFFSWLRNEHRNMPESQSYALALSRQL